MRITLAVTVLFVIIAGSATYFFPDQTETSWAWTINPPISAAFLGAGYLAAVVLEVFSIRSRFWAKAELGAPGVLAFSYLTLIATLMHLDRFHLLSFSMAGAWAWSWLLVYIFVPVILTVALIMQLRTPGERVSRVRPWPQTLLAIAAVLGVFFLIEGIVLFVQPGLLPWGWQLTPLTSKAIGAWWVGIGVLVLQGVIQNDLWRCLSLPASGTVFCVLQLANLVRFGTNLNFFDPALLVYIVSLLVMSAVSVVLLALSLTAERDYGEPESFASIAEKRSD